MREDKLSENVRWKMAVKRVLHRPNSLFTIFALLLSLRHSANVDVTI